MKLEIKSKIRNYEVIIEKGSLKNIKKYFDKTGIAVIITDDGVPKSWVELVQNQFNNAILITITQGENSKSFEQVELVVETLLKRNITRNDFIVSLGGGVVGDLAGFIASIYMRGIDYIQIPTTLLSQVDSSVGGKVAINTKNHKNSVGTFYPPKVVIIDTHVLSTLPEREYLCGLGEIIKYSVTFDRKMFEDLRQTKLKELDVYVEKCVKIKRELVENDELEKGDRKLLNFGHTIGHAIEILSRNEISHGEAVAIGMLLITENKEIYGEIKSMLFDKGYKTNVSFDIDNILEIVKKDKKCVNKNEIEIITLEKIGLGKIKRVSFDYVREILNKNM